MFVSEERETWVQPNDSLLPYFKVYIVVRRRSKKDDERRLMDMKLFRKYNISREYVKIYLLFQR